MSDKKLADSKTKVTLYLSPEVHRRTKIQAAVECESMSAVMEKALSFYLEHSDIVDGLMGQSHRVHECPACESSFVMRDGLPQLLQSHPAIAKETSLDRAMRLHQTEGVDVDGGRTDLVTC